MILSQCSNLTDYREGGELAPGTHKHARCTVGMPTTPPTKPRRTCGDGTGRTKRGVALVKTAVQWYWRTVKQWPQWRASKSLNGYII